MGFNHSARRCHDEGVATLGMNCKLKFTLKELNLNAANGDATTLWLMVIFDVDPA
jgi:hypothetical protein